MGIPIATIRSEGQSLDPTVELLSLEVRRELNRIPEAQLTLIDGSVAQRKFALSNTAFFEPGKRVTIALRYQNDGTDTTLFDGLVVRHGVEADARGSLLRVELKDAAFKLTRSRKSAVFRKQADDEAIRKLLGDAKLEVGELAVTQTKHEELIQYYASDWDFLVSRADVQGLVVQVDKGKISVQPMVSNAQVKARIEYGLGDTLEFDLTIDGAQQWAALKGVAWDIQKLQPTATTDAKPPSVSVGNLDPAAIAKKLGGDEYLLLHPGVSQPGELEAWASSRLARSRLSLLRGRLSLAGRSDILPRDVVELAGIGERFNGKALVSGVVDRVDHDGWRTELRLGLDPRWFAREPDIADLPAGGLLPPMLGLQIGVVSDFEQDAQSEQRVKVELAGMGKRDGAVWARVARPDAGKDRGFVYWPEPGDEVVVGFLYGDPRQAIVLGALHGPVNTPPTVVGDPSQKNDMRAIVSRSGVRIAFDDDKHAVSLETPGENKIVIDDAAKAITIADQHGNTITLDSKGITLKSVKDFTIDATSGKVVVKGNTVDVQ